MDEKSLSTAFGPLAALYNDPQIHTILVDAHDRVLVKRYNQEGSQEAGVQFESAEALQATLDAILAAAEVRLAPGQTVVDTRLAEGSRMLVILPPTAVNGPCLVVVKLPLHLITWEMLLEYGSITQEAMDALKSAILARRSMLIAGGYNSGKSTLMNLVAELIPAEARLVVVQTDFDLRMRHPRAVFLAAGEGNGPDLSELFTTASKMRADWHVFGELLGPEAMRAMELFSRGHMGLTTLHANSPEDALTRLETMCLKANLGLGLGEIRALIASALQLIVYHERLPDGKRRVLQIVELRGVENGRYVLQPLFRYNHDTGHLEAMGVRPGWE
jgi:pilus assembly protein CpaF